MVHAPLQLLVHHDAKRGADREIFGGAYVVTADRNSELSGREQQCGERGRRQHLLGARRHVTA